MIIRKTLGTLVFAVATLAPLAAFGASAPAAAPCILLEHRITAVTPYRVDVQRGRGTVQQLRGASVFVQAEPGLTAEWLQLTLGRHLKEMQGAGSMKDCAFDVRDVQVRATSTGNGFAINLIAREPSQAEELLRRARLLIG